MYSQNNGPRVSKLLLAYSKMQENIFVSIKDESLKERLNNTFKKTFDEYFKSGEDSIINKLNMLDEDIKNKRLNLRDIKCEKYIKEIYESYIFKNKDDIKNEIVKNIKICSEERMRLKSMLDEKMKKSELLEIELLKKENELESFIGKLSN